ncbi:MAG: DUF4160 domain-containing protein, partial [Actinomycetota bacterium]
GEDLPRISEFYGIVIFMYHDDHPPPHFHARYGGDWAKVSVASGEVVEGRLPLRAARLVREWAAHHRTELLADWELVQADQPPVAIEPLS